ncbi:MAG: hypothetical protein AAF639_36970 [Chloroflexota bacterium]
MKRILIIIGVFLLTNVVVTAIGVGLFFWRFVPRIPAVDFPTPQDQTEARDQDLTYLLNLTSIDHSFSKEAEAQFQAHVEQMHEQVSSMSDAEFAMEVAASVALADNGHTNVRIAYLADQLNSLPLRFFWFDDGLYIVRAHAEFAAFIGAQVVAYDGTPPEEIVQHLKQYYGGNEPNVRFNSPYFFASPAAMHGLGVATNPDQVSLTLRLMDGKTQETTVLVEEKQTETMRVVDHALAKNAKEEVESGNDWRFLDPEMVTLAHYGMHPEKQLWTDELPNDGFYIRMRITLDADDVSLSKWLADIQEQLKSIPVEYLVLDMRSNPGGDYTKTRTFAKAIANLVKPDGRIYTLTDGGTFSAAVVTAAFAKHGASSKGNRSQIVGSQMGDREQFWAEGGGVLTLPNSGVKVSVSTGYHDWENGCTDWRRCYWLNIVMGVAAGKLDPDINAPLTFADYSSGIDTTMQAVFEAEAVYSVDSHFDRNDE